MFPNGRDRSAGTTWSHVLKRRNGGPHRRLSKARQRRCYLFTTSSVQRRYNMPDTLKASTFARLTKGYSAYSDMGRILCSIIETPVGWHDP